MAAKTANKRKSQGANSVESKKCKTELQATETPETPVKLNGKAAPKAAKKNTKKPNKQNAVKEETTTPTEVKPETKTPTEVKPETKTSKKQKAVKKETNESTKAVKKTDGATSTRANKRKTRKIRLESLDITRITAQVTELQAKGDLTKTGKKKLRYLLKLQKKLTDGTSTTTPNAVAQTEVPNKKKGDKVAKGKKGKKSPVVGKEDSPAADDSNDDEVEDDEDAAEEESDDE